MYLKRALSSLIKSLQWRLVFIFIAMTIFLIIPIGLLLKMQVESSYYNEFKKNIIDGSKRWTMDYSPTVENVWLDLLNGENGRRQAIITFKIASENKSYTIVNKNDINDFKTTDPNLLKKPGVAVNDLLSSSNFVAVMSGSKGDSKNLARLNGTSFFDYAFEKDGIILYFRCYSEEWKEMSDAFSSIIISSLAFAVVISLILGYILSRTITVPIVNLMHKAQEVAKGNFDQTLEVKADDEIGQLTNTFNYMAQELKNTLTEISSEKNKIETIFNYMTDGVIAFNIKGKIIHCNPAAKRMLDIREEEEEFNGFCSKFGLDITLEEILYLDFSKSKEKNISTNDRFIKAYLDLFTDEKKTEGIIVVLQDVTEQQKLENMRNEFVANVSHELRTPLTSIKSYTETLLDGVLNDRETSEKFLEVINSEADRMTRLVKDLLQLTRLDNKQMQWNMKLISFTDLVKNCVVKMEIEAKNKSQELESYIMGDIPEITADKDRIEQVALNILSNAIKYTPEGGKVTVYISKLYSDVYMKVVDNGLGIPQKDLPRIFERFYRVDKARSRELGGTGLGLAIAREIVEAHGGNIIISSQYGKGTEVTVKLPVQPFSVDQKME